MSFILALEILFIFIKVDKNINRINIFNKKYLVKNPSNDTESFSSFSGFRSNFRSKNVNVALCSMKNIKLTKKSIKILGVHISYNNKIQDS